MENIITKSHSVGKNYIDKSVIKYNMFKSIDERVPLNIKEIDTVTLKVYKNLESRKL